MCWRKSYAMRYGLKHTIDFLIWQIEKNSIAATSSTLKCPKNFFYYIRIYVKHPPNNFLFLANNFHKFYWNYWTHVLSWTETFTSFPYIWYFCPCKTTKGITLVTFTYAATFRLAVLFYFWILFINKNVYVDAERIKSFCSFYGCAFWLLERNNQKM